MNVSLKVSDYGTLTVIIVSCDHYEKFDSTTTFGPVNLYETVIDRCIGDVKVWSPIVDFVDVSVTCDRSAVLYCEGAETVVTRMGAPVSVRIGSSDGAERIMYSLPSDDPVV